MKSIYRFMLILKEKKKLVLILSIIVCLLIAGVSFMHYKGYDRVIVRKIYYLFSDGNGSAISRKDWKYAAMLNDMNDLHLKSARALGIERPLKNRGEVKSVKKKLVRIKSNENYVVNNLSYSIPYLTEGAAELLDLIGKNFKEELKRRGIKTNKIVVTSVLRTQEDIKRLKRSGNVNASSNSAHCYGTTFDISYVRYGRRSNVSKAVLRDVLGDVLYKLRKQKKCYVKYEKRQRCFHITTRM